MHYSARYLVGLLSGVPLLLASLPGYSQTAPRMSLSSNVFSNGQPIPTAYTCNGNNTSPPLKWSHVPHNAKSLALTVIDVDAPGGHFVHWVVYNMPVNKTGLETNIAPQPQLPDGTEQGKNGAGSVGYHGPCPPSGTHHYYFRLYALNNKPNLPPGASEGQVQQAIRGHLVGQAQLIGTYAHP